MFDIQGLPSTSHHHHCCTAVLTNPSPNTITQGYDATTAYLTTLSAAAPNLVGIRQGLWVKEASFFYDDGFRAGLSALAAFDLPFDILVEHDQLGYTLDLATALPEVMFNLNHLGYPTITNATNWDSWVAGISALAALPNVYIKLSGLPQTYAEPGWTGESATHGCVSVCTRLCVCVCACSAHWF